MLVFICSFISINLLRNKAYDNKLKCIGFYLNLLPVRFHVPTGITFAQVAQNTGRQMGHALEKSVPFDMLLDHLKIARSPPHTPLFQVLVNYRLAMTKSIPFGNSSLTITDQCVKELITLIRLIRLIMIRLD